MPGRSTSVATLAALLLSLVCNIELSAQSITYIPDPNPTVPGGTAGNTIPFGNASYTYMGLVSASLLDPGNPQINDIGFAPSAVSGTWTAASVLVGIGHVANPIPCPFTFPGPGGATPGSFLDFSVIYDSSVQAPLSWTWTSQTFTSMGIAETWGPCFRWNGVDDIGVYVTYQGSTLTGAFLRNNATGGFPTRTYATGYQTATSTTCNASLGLVMSLSVSPGYNVLSITQSGPGVGDLDVSLSMISPTAFEGWTLLSASTANPMGTGPLLGLWPDPTTWEVLSYTYFPGNPFHFRTTDLGVYPNAPFTVPPGTMTALTGQTLDFVTFLLNNSLLYDSRSKLVRVTFQ
jgi:hypothetical protein